LGKGGYAWLVATPPVLGCFQALAGLEFTLEMGVEHLRAHSMAQKQMLAQLLPQLQGADKHYGAFVTLKHPGAVVLAGKMKERGIKVDARGDYLRLCPDILNTRVELERAAGALKDLLA
jgi:kynureninase